jgi:hypothetical protein
LETSVAEGEAVGFSIGNGRTDFGGEGTEVVVARITCLASCFIPCHRRFAGPELAQEHRSRQIHPCAPDLAVLEVIDDAKRCTHLPAGGRNPGKLPDVPSDELGLQYRLLLGADPTPDLGARVEGGLLPLLTPKFRVGRIATLGQADVRSPRQDTLRECPESIADVGGE